MAVDNHVPTTDSVLQAIDALYNDPNPKVKEDASAYLCEFQKSVYAWQIADQLLYMHRDLNTSYIGAQTIRNKILNHFSELPAESHDSLKNSLLSHIDKLTSDIQAPIANQLCLAIADLVCNMVQWKEPVKEILSRFASSSAKLTFLVDILRFIPEEINNKSMRLGQNRRYALYGECESNKGIVTQFLEECFNANSSDMKMVARILNCLGSWWDSSVMRESDIVNSPLLSAIFTILREPLLTPDTTYEAASQCLMDIFYQCHDVHMFPELLSKLQLGTYSLLSIYNACVSRADLVPRCAALCRVFTEQMSTLLRPLTSNPDPQQRGGFSDMRTLECVIVCTEHPSRELCLITFNTLTSFAESVAKNRDNTATMPLIPYFNRLVLSLVHHSRLSHDDHDGLEEVREFRHEVFDLMQDVQCVVGAESIFNQMLSHMKELESKGCGWIESEACLFIIASVAKRLDSRDTAQSRSQLISTLLPILPNAPHTFQEVAFFLFGELSMWSTLHPDLRSPMVEVMCNSIQSACSIQPGHLSMTQKNALGAALTSLGNVCYSGRHAVLQQQWPRILAVIESLPLLPVILRRESVELYEGVTRALTGHHPHNSQPIAVNDLTDKLTHIFNVNTACINKLIESNIPIEANNTPSDPCVWIDYLSSIFSTLRQSARPDSTNDNRSVNQLLHEPFLEVVRNQAMPMIGRVMAHYFQRSRVMERVTRLVRFIVRGLGEYVKEILPTLATVMVETYNKNQFSCFLYLGSVLVDEFGTLSDCQSGLVQMFEAFCQPTLYMLESVQAISENHESVEDLFRMLSRLVQRCPHALLTCNNVPVEQLAFLAVRTLPLTHAEAASIAANRFLSEILVFLKEEKDTLACEGGDETAANRIHLWLQNGESCGGKALVEAVVHSGSLYLYNERIPDLTEIILLVRTMATPELFSTWFESAIQSLPLQRSDGLVQATDKQIANFRHAMCNSDLESAQEAFEDFAKLFR